MILGTKMMMMMMIMKIIMMMIKTLSLRDDAVGAYCSGDLKLIWDSLGILVPRDIARGHIQSCLAGERRISSIFKEVTTISKSSQLDHY